MSDHELVWGQYKALSNGEFLGHPRVRRTPAGWVVEQFRWKHSTRLGKVGSRVIHRWMQDEAKARAYAETL